MATRYKMVRLSEGTHARLVEFRDWLFAAYQAGKIDTIPDAYAEHLPLDFVISQLLSHKLAHRERARKARSGRKKTQDDPEGRLNPSAADLGEACIQPSPGEGPVVFPFALEDSA